MAGESTTAHSAEAEAEVVLQDLSPDTRSYLEGIVGQYMDQYGNNPEVSFRPDAAANLGAHVNKATLFGKYQPRVEDGVIQRLQAEGEKQVNGELVARARTVLGAILLLQHPAWAAREASRVNGGGASMMQ